MTVWAYEEQETWRWPAKLLKAHATGEPHRCSIDTLMPITRFARDELVDCIEQMDAFVRTHHYRCAT